LRKAFGQSGQKSESRMKNRRRLCERKTALSVRVRRVRQRQRARRPLLRAVCAGLSSTFKPVFPLVKMMLVNFAKEAPFRFKNLSLFRLANYKMYGRCVLCRNEQVENSVENVETHRQKRLKS